jgi:phospholipid/cholesterol/gamma-HCH transport system ATP-binding protein
MIRTLECENVERAFGDSQVIRGLTVTIPFDGLTFVVGQSGSGKSVLCRLAVGLLRPDRGQVRVLGQAVSGLPERRLQALRAKVPYLVQGPALLDWLTVEENVRLTAPGRSAEVASRALAQLGLEDWKDRLPTTLGPAAKKRVAIARALALGPEYLLLDEPTTGLDRASARRVNAAIGQLKTAGFGALVVTHDYESLRQLADRVLVIARGKAAFLGTVPEFFASALPEVRVLTEAALG